jgi:hypothetical protein
MPQGDAELMTKEQVLGFLSTPRLEQVGDEHSERAQDREHRSEHADSTLRRESRPDEIFGKDRRRQPPNLVDGILRPRDARADFREVGAVNIGKGRRLPRIERSRHSAEAAVTSQNFIHSSKLGDSSRSLGGNPHGSCRG